MKKFLSLFISVLTICAIGASSVHAGTTTTPPPNPTGLNIATPPIIPTGTSPGQSGTPPTTMTSLSLPGVGSDNAQALQTSVLPTITNLVIGLTGGLALLFVIISGIQILTAYGSEEKIGAAKKTLTWALAGLIISILSFAIVQVVISINIT
jgi:hypothetical protein